MNVNQSTNRNELLSLFKTIKHVCNRCEPLYNEYSSLEQMAEEEKGKCAQIWVIRNILAGVSALLLILALTNRHLFIWTVLSALVTVGLSIVVTNMKKKAAGVLHDIRSKQDSLLDKIDDIYSSSGVDEYYPQKYLYSEAVDYCQDVVDNMRAESVKEALNLYEDELYKARMEAMQHSSLKAQREVAESLKTLETESRKTRKAAQFAAVASGVSAYYTQKIKKNLQ
ncbi:MAG: hypothetical protein Q4E38_02420 [Eubacteriales bacterium]|nr:hypothetical protein [Eubacteriales bacterium]